MFPADQLARRGGHKCVLPAYEKVHESEGFMSIRWLLHEVPDVDLYVFQMPFLKEYCQVVDQLKRLGKRIIVELDDDYRHIPAYNPAEKATRPGNRGGGDRRYLDFCVRRADALTVSTPAIRDSYAEIYKGPIFVLRNCLDWLMWEDAVCPWDRPNPRGRVRVGYLGTLQWHSADLDVLKPWFGDWLSANPNVDFVAAGDSRMHDYLGVPEGQRVSTAGLAFRHRELSDIVATFDIGLVPLELNRFNQGKSHLKGLEYAGAGVPFIASPSESYSDYWLRGDGGLRPGFLAVGPNEWVCHLDRLAADGVLRRRMGELGRLEAQERSIQNHWREWEEVYVQVLGDHSYASRPRVDAFGVYI